MSAESIGDKSRSSDPAQYWLQSDYNGEVQPADRQHDNEKTTLNLEAALLNGRVTDKQSHVEVRPLLRLLIRPCYAGK